MDNFRIIYKMLKALESAMDCDEFDASRISPEALRVTPERRDRLLAMMVSEGYVTGVKVSHFDNSTVVTLADPRITLAGLEYLADNSLMRKAARMAKGLVDVVT